MCIRDSTCRYLPKVVTTNSSSLMIRMLENSDLCNVGSYWLSEMYRQNDFGKIRIEGLEQKIRFGYLKYQGRPLIPGLLSDVYKRQQSMYHSIILRGMA